MAHEPNIPARIDAIMEMVVELAESLVPEESLEREYLPLDAERRIEVIRQHITDLLREVSPNKH